MEKSTVTTDRVKMYLFYAADAGPPPRSVCPRLRHYLINLQTCRKPTWAEEEEAAAVCFDYTPERCFVIER